MKLNAKALGLTSGIFWGIGLALLTVISLLSGGYASQFLAVVADVYPGFEVSYMGALVGLLYGFVDGFICCYIFGFLYNLLTDKLK